MTLFRYLDDDGETFPGVLIDGTHYSLAEFFDELGQETGAFDLDEFFFEAGGLEQLQAYLDEFGPSELEPIEGDIDFDSCVARPSKIICVGLNYADHARETGAEIPKEPIVFFKATTALCGPNDDVIIPKNSQKTDWEVELAVVIGQEASYVDEADALDYVAGYAVMNDLSEREFQLERGGTWDKGKGNDTFGPLGPWMVTADEVKDPQNLKLWLEVDGKRYQDGSTKTMIFTVQQVVAYLSKFMSLQPGDVISTGTPPGVGLGQKPPVYLKPGQTMHLGIEGLGSQTQEVIAA